MHSNGICHTGLLIACEQRSCLKHVEFCSKNKSEKLVHLVGFIIRIQFSLLTRRLKSRGTVTKMA